jgi:hypothetical protein
MAGKIRIYLQESANNFVVSRLNRRGYEAEGVSPEFASKILSVSFQGTGPKKSIMVLIDPKVEDLKLEIFKKSGIQFLAILDLNITMVMLLSVDELEEKLEEIYDKLSHVAKGRLRFNRAIPFLSIHQPEWFLGQEDNWPLLSRN